jgi:hypothetical protein
MTDEEVLRHSRARTMIAQGWAVSVIAKTCGLPAGLVAQLKRGVEPKPKRQADAERSWR